MTNYKTYSTLSTQSKNKLTSTVQRLERNGITAKDSLDAGGKGTCFGRNVWGDPNAKNIIAALKEITHQNAEVDEVWKKYNLG